MSPIQLVTSAMLASQSVLPDRELNTLYRYVAIKAYDIEGYLNANMYVLQWRKYANMEGWFFVDAQDQSIVNPQVTIQDAVELKQQFGFTVYRITNSSL